MYDDIEETMLAHYAQEDMMDQKAWIEELAAQLTEDDLPNVEIWVETANGTKLAEIIDVRNEDGTVRMVLSL